MANSNAFIACKDCSDKHPGCHDKCEIYISAKSEHERIKALERQYKEVWGYSAILINSQRNFEAIQNKNKRRYCKSFE